MREFWVFNISKRDVSLGDLNLTIKSKSCVNILKNSQITYEQAVKSSVNGSLFLKRDMIHIVQNKKNINHGKVIKTLDKDSISQTVFNQRLVWKNISYQRFKRNKLPVFFDMTRLR